MHLHPTTISNSTSRSLRLGRLLLLASSVGACDAPAPTLGAGPPVEPRSGSASSLATLSLGSTTTCVATLSGGAKCWGLNDAGQLGRGDAVDIGDDESPSEAEFIQLGGSALEVRTNGPRSFARMDDGRVLAWGENSDGALGLGHDDTIGDDEDPSGAEVSIGGWASELAVGEDFACVRLQNGLVRCWGANEYGQLGRAHTERIGDDELPSDEPAVWLGGPVQSITAGLRHVCALHGQGLVRCWGSNDSGQLGYGHEEAIGDDEHPVLVDDVALSGPAVQIAAGSQHTCAVLDDGAVQCWGDNSWGQLGYGHDKEIGDDESPVDAGVVSVGASVQSIALGREHTCAVLDSGALNCWGRGDQGQLGRGSPKPVGIGQTPAEAGSLDLGGLAVLEVYGGSLTWTTCALFDDENLRCWGENDRGQQGYGHLQRWGGQRFETPGTLPDIVVFEDDDDS